MDLHPNRYYHLYNRSNNAEIAFKIRENYLYFLKKYRPGLADSLDTIGYCLMPTHFHFLVYIRSEDVHALKKRVGTLSRRLGIFQLLGLHPETTRNAGLPGDSESAVAFD